MHPANRTYRLLSVLLSLCLVGAALAPTAQGRCRVETACPMPCCTHPGPVQGPQDGRSAACDHGHGATTPAGPHFVGLTDCGAQPAAAVVQAPAGLKESSGPSGSAFAGTAPIRLAPSLPVHPAHVLVAPEEPAVLPSLDRNVLYASFLI